MEHEKLMTKKRGRVKAKSARIFVSNEQISVVR